MGVSTGKSQTSQLCLDRIYLKVFILLLDLVLQLESKAEL